jgi:hypothetical protein
MKAAGAYSGLQMSATALAVSANGRRRAIRDCAQCGPVAPKRKPL